MLQAPLKVGCLIGLLAALPLLSADDRKPPPATAERSSLNDSLTSTDPGTSPEAVALPKAAELPDGIGESLSETSPADALDQIESALQAAEVTSAKAQLTAYIEQIEAATQRYSPDLIAPLVLLGDTQMIEQDYSSAIESYGRAVHIDRLPTGCTHLRRQRSSTRKPMH